jgi:hypothetical protein
MINVTITDVVAFIVGPVILVTLLLLGVRAANRNWRFSMRGMLMLITLLAIGMAAILRVG